MPILWQSAVLGAGLLAVSAGLPVHADGNSGGGDGGGGIKHVFVVAMENHNWTQPANQFSGPIQQIFHNSNAPFINSLVNGTAVATINGRQVNISRQVAYATNYHNVLATASGNNPHIHPSEPNYIWAEAGTNFTDVQRRRSLCPQWFTDQVNNQDNQLHLARLLTQAGRTGSLIRKTLT